MAYLSIKNVHKVYPNGTHAVDNFNLEVEKNDFVVILGPSGCGKSTMLRMIAGLEGITSGEMILDQKKINGLSPKDRDIAMVFQNYALYNHMSVYDNIGFSLLVRKKNRRIVHEKVLNASSIVQITDDQLKRKPDQLSGGQKQRVALGRTITRDTKLFLMDEPLSNLDAKLRGSMRVEIMELYRTCGLTVVYVSHDQIEAMTMATKIVLMNKGVIEQIGTPQYIYDHPANLFVATFLGTPQINLIPGEVKEGKFIHPQFEIELDQYKTSTNDRVFLGIRSEALEIVSENGDFEIAIDYVEFLGAKSIVYGFLDQTGVAVQTKERVADSEKCQVKIHKNKVVLFDAKTTRALEEERI